MIRAAIFYFLFRQDPLAEFLRLFIGILLFALALNLVMLAWHFLFKSVATWLLLV